MDNHGGPPYFVAPGGNTLAHCSAVTAAAAAVKLPGFSCYYDGDVGGYSVVVDATECAAVADGINAAIFAPTPPPTQKSSTGNQGATTAWIAVSAACVVLSFGGAYYWHRRRSAAAAAVKNLALGQERRSTHDGPQLQSPHRSVNGVPEEELVYDEEIDPAVFNERGTFCNQCGIELDGVPKFCRVCGTAVV